MHGRLLQTDSICRGRYASPGAIDVHVFHLRQRLAPCDIAIISVHGHGYRTSGPRDRHGADCDWPRSAVISRVGALMRARTPSNFRLRGMFF